ncbi:uncharacterized protein LOC105689820 [Athalia rosae]|uniref:uncharacterized protein LOC105689820 n=1 Tax=Athalia rosae TaxID=37344 RepID=UPI002034A31C|nr:uncharacterized protein LOC105689820 [Athalia rosae]
MVRTVRSRAAEGGTRVGAKAPRKTGIVGPSMATKPNSQKKGRDNGGGNSYFPRETPSWQKPITSFFNLQQPESGESSGTQQKTGVVTTDSTDDSQACAGPSTAGNTSD